MIYYKILLKNSILHHLHYKKNKNKTSNINLQISRSRWQIMSLFSFWVQINCDKIPKGQRTCSLPFCFLTVECHRPTIQKEPNETLNGYYCINPQFKEPKTLSHSFPHLSLNETGHSWNQLHLLPIIDQIPKAEPNQRLAFLESTNSLVKTRLIFLLN